MKSITIKDIAKDLGISVSTVSRALQNHPDISEQTKESVRNCAVRLNYKPNIMASNLRRSKNTTIGAFIMLRYVPSIPAFWRVFIINGC